MSIEEIIKALEGFQRMSEGISGVVNDPERKAHYAERAQALREAIALLKTHQDAQPNEPLTLEELRGMVGKPVYVSGIGVADCDSWQIVSGVDTDDGGTLYCWGGYTFRSYGQAWLAYRRQPKED